MTHMNLISTLPYNTYCYTFLRTKIKYAKKKPVHKIISSYMLHIHIYIINDIRISSQ